MAEREAAAIDSPVVSARGGKYLTFVLGQEEYGIGIMHVREIIGMMAITAVPQTPDFVKGVINLRGKVIPVIDLRLKFGLPEVQHTAETCVIVVEVRQSQMGVIVDTVREVMDIEDGQIEDPPRFGTKVDTEFILGMGKVGNKVEILLDIGKVLTSEEMVLTESLAGDAPEEVGTA